MRPLSAAEVLTVWESSMHQPLVEKSLQLLRVACSATDHDSLAHIAIGERDARLLQLRKGMFGSRLENLAICPQCAEPIEWTMDIADLQLQQPHTKNTAVFTLQVDEFDIRFRLPDSADVSKAVSTASHQPDAKKLLCACILEARRNQSPFNTEDLPESIFESLNKRMSEEDPMANISMLVSCPACSHSWEVLFDIASYLWAEINNWSKHILQEVYVLASAFGWSEHDILNMSPRRRQVYLEMVRS